MSRDLALKLLSAIIIVASGIYMTMVHLLHPLILIIIAVCSIPWLREIYIERRRAQYDNVRKLKRHLPKSGFTIEEIVPQKESIRFVGKYREETIVIESGHDTAYVTIIDPAWLRIAATDPNLPKFMEAINITNGQCGPTIVCSTPDADGNRFIHTMYSTIMPGRYVDDFLTATLREMLDKQRALQENFRDYPWLSAKKKRPMGFTAPTDDSTSPAVNAC